MKIITFLRNSYTTNWYKNALCKSRGAFFRHHHFLINSQLDGSHLLITPVDKESGDWKRYRKHRLEAGPNPLLKDGRINKRTYMDLIDLRKIRNFYLLVIHRSSSLGYYLVIRYHLIRHFWTNTLFALGNYKNTWLFFPFFHSKNISIFTFHASKLVKLQSKTSHFALSLFSYAIKNHQKTGFLKTTFSCH